MPPPFNEALAKHKVFILSSDAFKELTIKMAKADSLINELRDYPSSYKEAFDESGITIPYPTRTIIHCDPHH